MPNKTLEFEIVTPEKTVFQKTVLQVTAPTTQGEITVLPSHLPLVTMLQPGVIEVVEIDGKRDIIYVAGGFLEILKNKVVILADSAEKAIDLDLIQIEEAKKRAEKAKTDLQHGEHLEFANLNAIIAKEMAKTHAIKRWKKVRNIE